MVQKKIDNRIRTLIENGVCSGYRSLFAIVGNKSKDQVVYLHHMLSKTSLKQANVLWCYKKSLELSSNRKKRMKQLKAKRQFGNGEPNEDDPFEMFVSMTDIRYCYYKETHKILGNTFKMCVIQDFEAITPNILCRTIETVEGGGLIILLLESMTSLKQLYTLNMDVHARFRTEVHQNLIPRFNERFLLSLASCPSCIVLNDEMQILPISSLTKEIEQLPFTPRTTTPLSKREKELQAFKDDTKESKPLGTLISLCRTMDQAEVVNQFIEAVTKKTLNSTLTLTAARGRGKSAAMGLALAGAIAVGYSNMYVTSPSPENLNTFFEFLLKGLDSLGYEKHIHYQTLVSSNPDFNKSVMRIIINKDHRQVVQYISPIECSALDNAELVVIDEAAAIPLVHVQALLGPYLVFLASTVSGYEGTGRSLSLKLIKQLRENKDNLTSVSKDTTKNRELIELELSESIRYKDGDPIEKWLYGLLCLDASLPPLKNNVPKPDNCNLFYVSRDTLFSYHKISERFLEKIMSLLVSSHYRNCPDDLQTLSDAPAHQLYVLLPPAESDNSIPPILCVIQVALEGKIEKKSLSSASGSRKPSGDLIPWTMNTLFQDDDFPQLSGARIVRIATHPDLQGLGYGSRAIGLLEEYFCQASWDLSTEEDIEPTLSSVQEEEVGLLTETITPRNHPHPLLLSTSERKPDFLHYIGVSFGVSAPLLKFWKKAGFTCVYLSQIRNVITGEHSCLLLKDIRSKKGSNTDSWLEPLWFDFAKRILFLLPGPFHHLESPFSLSFLSNKQYKRKAKAPSFSELKLYLSQYDLKRLDSFSRNQCDFPLIADVLPCIAMVYFLRKIPNFKIKSSISSVILVGVGLQRKTPSTLAKELGLDVSVIMSQMHTLITELSQHLTQLWEACKIADVEAGNDQDMTEESVGRIVSQVTSEISNEIEHCKKVEKELGKDIENIDFSQFAIKSKDSEVVTERPKGKRLAEKMGETFKKFKRKK